MLHPSIACSFKTLLYLARIHQTRHKTVLAVLALQHGGKRLPSVEEELRRMKREMGK